MITIILDHSYEDNYFMISTIEIRDIAKSEEERILENFRKLQDRLVDVDNDLKNRIAKTLQVDVKLIDIDTNEIDFIN